MLYQQAAEYWFLCHGAQLVYTNAAHVKKDISREQPHFLIAVPRVYEALYTGLSDRSTQAYTDGGP